MARAALWPFILVGVLLVALATLASLQMRWIDDAARAEEQRVRTEIDEAVNRLTSDVTREIFSAIGIFEISDANAAELSSRYDRWRATARDPQVLRDIYVVTEQRALRFLPATHTFESVPEAPQESGVMFRGAMRNGGEFILVFDRAKFIALAADAARRNVSSDFDVALANQGAIVYRSDPQWPSSLAAANADAARSLMPKMRRTMRAPAPLERNDVLVLVRHHGIPLREVFAAKRRREMSAAFAILFLFAASLVILAGAARRAERLRRQQMEFVAGVTHELHTPLAALAAAGQNLADGISVDIPKYGAAIVKEARRLTDLVDEVLAFSGMEAAHSTEPADVASVIREAIAECDGIAAERRVAIESVVDDSLPTVECAPAAATRAVHNLIANAIRHGGDGGWVGVRASAQNGDVVITVADRGPGIVAADLPHLFEPFYRGRNSQVRGSGLGLAIVDRVARTHGGSVTAANRTEGGAEFRLRLPVTS